MSSGDIGKMDDQQLLNYLKANDFTLLPDDMLKLGSKCTDVFSKMTGKTTRDAIYITNAKQKINSCLDGYLNSLKQSQSWVASIIENFPTHKQLIPKLHDTLAIILQPFSDEARLVIVSKLSPEIEMLLKTGAKIDAENFLALEARAVKILNAHIQLNEGKAIYKEFLGVDCTKTTLAEVRDDFKRAVGNKFGQVPNFSKQLEEKAAELFTKDPATLKRIIEALGSLDFEKVIKPAAKAGVDVVAIASKPLSTQQEELISRQIATGTEAIKELMQQTASKRFQLEKERDGSQDRLQSLQNQTPKFTSTKEGLEAKYKSVYEARQNEVIAKAANFSKLNAAATNKAQTSIDQKEEQLRAIKGELDKVVKEFTALTDQHTELKAHIEKLDGEIAAKKQAEKEELALRADQLAANVKAEVKQKTPTTILQELISLARIEANPLFGPEAKAPLTPNTQTKELVAVGSLDPATKSKKPPEDEIILSTSPGIIVRERPMDTTQVASALGEASPMTREPLPEAVTPESTPPVSPFAPAEALMSKILQEPTLIADFLVRLLCPLIQNATQRRQFSELLLNPDLAAPLSLKYLPKVSEKFDKAVSPQGTGALKTLIGIVSPRLSEAATKAPEATPDAVVHVALKNALGEVSQLLEAMKIQKPSQEAGIAQDVSGLVFGFIEDMGKYRDNEAKRKKILGAISKTGLAVGALNTTVFGAKPVVAATCGQIVSGIEKALPRKALSKPQLKVLETNVRAIVDAVIDTGITDKLMQLLNIVEKYLKDKNIEKEQLVKEATPILQEIVTLVDTNFLAA